MRGSAYKIMAANGEFSSGGTYPSFSPEGKAWASRRALNLHLAHLGSWGRETYAVAAVTILEANFEHKFFSQYSLEEWEYITNLRRLAREAKRDEWKASQQGHLDQGAGI